MSRLAWIVSLSGGCVHHAGDEEQLAFQSALGAADRLWEARGSEGYDAIDRALAAVPARYAQHSEVRWRRARVAVARGVAAEDPATARRFWATARDEGEQCALDDATVRAHWRDHGWTDATAYLGHDRALCLVWGAEAWARWMISFGGVAASLDEATVRAWVEGVAMLGDDVSRMFLLRGLVATAQDDPIAQEHLLAAYGDGRGRRNGEAWVLWEDLLRIGPPPAGVSAPPRGPESPEERAAVTRVGQQRPGR